MINDNEIEFRASGFGYVNPEALIVLVGITPGNTQLRGSRCGKTSREVKRENAFAGGMRKNLVRMLDYIGVNKLLGIISCESFWDEDFDKVEMTSLLKNATYYKGKMFNRASDILRSRKLTRAFNNGFRKDCSRYSKAVLFIAMGGDVGKVLSYMVSKGNISVPVVAVPHPSGANAGRIAVFLGAKPAKHDLASERAHEQAIHAKLTVSKITSMSGLRGRRG